MSAPFLRALCDAGGDVSEVGGQVRDQLLGRQTLDGDYVVRKLPTQTIVTLLKAFGKVTLVGQSFGVIKFSPHRTPQSTIDIALPRKEYSTGRGHRDFDVSFDPNLPIEEDLGRRDFTINAMARNVVTGKLIDPFHGQRDLDHKILRMVFPKAFEEDPLRLLRGVQFAARFHLAVEAETLAAMQQSAQLITTVAAERIIAEIGKLMIAPKPSVGFRLMAETGLLKLVIPELQALIGINQDKQPGDDVFDHTMRALDAARSDSALLKPGDMDLMFAMLMHDIGKATTARYHAPSKRIVFFGHQLVSAKLAKKWLARMKAETIGLHARTILTLIEHHMFETKASFTERAIRRFIAKVGKDLIFPLMDLRLADNRGGKHPDGIKGVLRLRKRIQDELDKKPPFGPKDLAVNGCDLMSLGIPEGRMLGVILNHLVEVVLDDPEHNTREDLLALAAQMKENLARDIKKTPEDEKAHHEKS